MCVKKDSEERSEPSKSDNLGNFHHRSNAQLLMKIHVNLLTLCSSYCGLCFNKEKRNLPFLPEPGPHDSMEDKTFR